MSYEAENNNKYKKIEKNEKTYERTNGWVVMH